MKIDFVEFSSADVAASKAFFARAFGWGFVDYGPQYQALADAGLDGGIDGSGEAPAAFMAGILSLEFLVHAWDYATAIGRPISAPSPLSPRAPAASATSIICLAFPRTNTTSGAHGSSARGA